MNGGRLITMRELVRHVRRNNFDYGEQARVLFDRKNPDTPITCKAGCARCCNQKVITDAGTGAVIYLYLKQQYLWSPAMERRLVEADRLQTRLTHAEVMDQRIPCPLLAEKAPGEGRCIVHPVRPLACVSSFSTTTNPDDCWEVNGHATFRVHDDGAADACISVMRDLLRSAGETNVMLMTLPAAVLYGRALIEGLPKPDVHVVPWQKCDEEGRVERDVDAVADSVRAAQAVRADDPAKRGADVSR